MLLLVSSRRSIAARRARARRGKRHERARGRKLRKILSILPPTPTATPCARATHTRPGGRPKGRTSRPGASRARRRPRWAGPRAAPPWRRDAHAPGRSVNGSGIGALDGASEGGSRPAPRRPSGCGPACRSRLRCRGVRGVGRAAPSICLSMPIYLGPNGPPRASGRAPRATGTVARAAAARTTRLPVLAHEGRYGRVVLGAE